jgi:hypothetical protein
LLFRSLVCLIGDMTIRRIMKRKKAPGSNPMKVRPGAVCWRNG